MSDRYVVAWESRKGLVGGPKSGRSTTVMSFDEARAICRDANGRWPHLRHWPEPAGATAIDTLAATVRGLPPPIPTGPLCLMTSTGARACADTEVTQRIADTIWSRDKQPLTDNPAGVTCPGCKPHAARLIRERNRRAIDALLAEDARRFPVFAEARRAAIVAAGERKADDMAAHAAGLLLAALREYEDGCCDADGTIVRLGSVPWQFRHCVAAYERARSAPRLLGRPTGSRPPMPQPARERDYLGRWRP